MLSGIKIIAVYCLMGNILNGISYKEDSRRKTSNTEVITTAVVLSFFKRRMKCQKHYEDDRNGASDARPEWFIQAFALLPLINRQN